MPIRGGDWQIVSPLNPATNTYRYDLPALSSTSVSVPTASGAGASTGVNPIEQQYSLYGHIVPLNVFGRGRIGGEIISGPWSENGRGSGIVSFGVQADPARVLTLIEIAFDSEVVWTGSLVGAGTPASSGFSTEPFTCRFYTGSLTQAADPLEIAHFGAAEAVGYRGQILLAFDSLPLANMKFKKFPYVAAKFVDQDGEAVNFGEAFERLAYSPYVGLTADDFETSGITDGVADGGLLITQDVDFLSLLQQFGRFYPNWDILQTDKLRLVDRGASVKPDIKLDATRLLEKPTVQREGPEATKRDLELSTIDPDADYTIVPYRAQRPRDPVAVTTSVGADTAYLPVIMDASTRAVVATFANYYEDTARKTIGGTAMAFGCEIEPGDLVGFQDLGSDFTKETFKVFETLLGANMGLEFSAKAILKCEIADPYFSSVILLLGFEGADGSQGAPGFTDESPLAQGTANVIAGAEIDTSNPLVGSSSLLITGTNTVGFNYSDQLSAANSDEFTVEAQVYFNDFTDPVGAIVGQNLLGVAWYFAAVSATREMRLVYYDTSNTMHTIDTVGAGLGAGVKYHVAVDKDSSGKIRIYVDGVMLGSATPSNSAFKSGSFPIFVGSASLFGGLYHDGWIDELRITKGVARYASDNGFPPITGAFPRP